MRIFGYVACVLLWASATQCVAAQDADNENKAAAQDFNAYILRAIELVNTSRAMGGYDINKAFSQDLDYGGAKIAASQTNPPRPTPSMCVAGVSEVLIEAINLYAKDHPKAAVHTKLPSDMWTSGKRSKLRAHIFQYRDSGSRGTAHALKTFGLGDEIGFNTLRAGDVVNFSRTTNSGHAVIFIHYIDAAGALLANYDSNTVAGFRYFSVQGKGRRDAGFGYRNAYFKDKCPRNRLRDDDCNVIAGHRTVNGVFTQNYHLFNTGRMYAPPLWTVDAALAAMKAATVRTYTDQEIAPTRAAELASNWLDQELQPVTARYEDGSSL